MPYLTTVKRWGIYNMPPSETMKQEVREILIKNESSRGNDLLLICLYLKEHLGVKFEPLTASQLRHGGVCGTVSRIRREIQNKDGVLLPQSPAVRKQRRINEDRWRDWAVRDKQ